MFVDDYRELRIANAEPIARRSFLFEKFVNDLLDHGPDKAGFDERAESVAIHAHCHAKSLLKPAFMAELVERNDAEEFARLLGAARRVILTIRLMTKPVIASIEGACAGAGFNLALACDLRVASSNATFSQSFVKLGFHPDWGGSYFLPRMVPSNIACELFFLGDAIDANTALRLGLINRVVAPEDLAGETYNLAERLRDGPAVSIAAAKHAVYAGEHDSLEQMLQYEVEAQLRCFQSEDGREGVRAFLEKRPPKFTGK